MDCAVNHPRDVGQAFYGSNYRHALVGTEREAGRRSENERVWGAAVENIGVEAINDPLDVLLRYFKRIVIGTDNLAGSAVVYDELCGVALLKFHPRLQLFAEGSVEKIPQKR